MKSNKPHYASTKPEAVAINTCLLEYNFKQPTGKRPIDTVMRSLSPADFPDPELRKVYTVLQNDYVQGNLHTLASLKSRLCEGLWIRVLADSDLRPWNEKTVRFAIRQL